MLLGLVDVSPIVTIDAVLDAELLHQDSSLAHAVMQFHDSLVFAEFEVLGNLISREPSFGDVISLTF